MARTFADKEQAAAEIAKRLANRDLDETAWRDAASLREIAGAFADQVAAERRVAEAVRVARGRSLGRLRRRRGEGRA